jgi:ParB family chromosome partitioning protein
MAKATEAPRKDAYMLWPEDLVLITDKTHKLYDERVEWDPSEGLIRSIMYQGVIEPIIVARDGDKTVVVNGRQRVKAAIVANKRLETEGKEKLRVLCVFRKGTEGDFFGVAVSANECRRDDSPMAKARKVKTLIDFGKTEDEIAFMYGVGVQAVKNWHKLNDCSDLVKDAVDSGKITASAAAKLAGKSREDQDTIITDLLAAAAAPAPGTLPLAGTAGPGISATPPKPGSAAATLAKFGKKPRSSKTPKAPKITAKKVAAAVGEEKGIRGIKEVKEELLKLKACSVDSSDDYRDGYKAALRWVLYK